MQYFKFEFVGYFSFKKEKVTIRKQNYGATIAISLSHRTTLRVILNGELRASHVKDLFCEAKFTLENKLCFSHH